MTSLLPGVYFPIRLGRNVETAGKNVTTIIIGIHIQKMILPVERISLVTGVSDSLDPR